MHSSCDRSLGKKN